MQSEFTKTCLLVIALATSTSLQYSCVACPPVGYFVICPTFATSAGESIDFADVTVSYQVNGQPGNDWSAGCVLYHGERHGKWTYRVQAQWKQAVLVKEVDIRTDNCVPENKPMAFVFGSETP